MNAFNYIKSGYCPICEENTVFESKNSWLRGHYRCPKCMSRPGERALMYIIQELYKDKYKFLKIHESSPANRGVSYKFKKICNNYIQSQYFPNCESKLMNGFYNIDLQNQYFEDKMFDLVITQDVFEHLPKPDLALKEIYRTLKKGGYFISTIPLVNKFNPTVKWADYVDGKIKWLYNPEYHGNPIDEKGSPVFWHYGYDIANLFIEWSNFTTIIFSLNIERYGIEGEYNDVIVCKK